MKKLVMRFVKNESGATAIEYGLIAAGISVAIIAVVNTLGTSLKGTFSNISSNLGHRSIDQIGATHKGLSSGLGLTFLCRLAEIKLAAVLYAYGDILLGGIG